MYWDDTNSRLGIGTTTPAYKLEVSDGTRTCIFHPASILDGFFIGTKESKPLVFGTNDTERMRLFAGGNFNIGGTTDGGQRLQVQGDAFIKGSGNTGFTIGLTVQDSAGLNLLRIFNNGNLRLGTINILPFSTQTGSPNANGTNVAFLAQTTSQSATLGRFYFGGENQTQTSGNAVSIYSDEVFSPSGGTATKANILIASTINQTGGANGITRGLYIAPTLTAAADWRSIEWSNNSGWGLYGAGTANNYLGGSLGIGTTSPIGKLETFNNSIYIGGALSMYSNTASDESIFYFRRGRGTLASPTTVTNGDTIGSIRFAVQYNSSVGGYNTNAKIDSIVESSGANLCFYTNSGGIANSTIAERMRLTAAGRLLLGTTTESTFLLDVNGTARVSDNLIVSKNQSLTTNITISNTNSGSSVQCALYLANNLSSLAGAIIKNSSTTTAYKILGSGDLCIYNDSVANNGDISILNDRPAGIIKFAAGGSSTAQLQIETTGKVSYAAATSAKAQINLASGTAPTSPVNGDIWFDGTDLKMRIGGVTKTFTLV
jgi:hypothetical protein